MNLDTVVMILWIAALGVVPVLSFLHDCYRPVLDHWRERRRLRRFSHDLDRWIAELGLSDSD